MIIILVVLVAGLLQTRRTSHDVPGHAGRRWPIAHAPPPIGRTVVDGSPREAARPGWRVRLAEQPTLVLAGVFVVLYAITAWQDDSLLRVAGIRSILLLACPLAIFAASQTLCMLTGGIDLSVAMTANLAAYLAATESGRGTVPALAIALGVGIAVGFVNGLAIGVFRVNPLIMTLGMASILLGIVTVGLRGFLVRLDERARRRARGRLGDVVGPAAEEPHRLAGRLAAARARSPRRRGSGG